MQGGPASTKEEVESGLQKLNGKEEERHGEKETDTPNEAVGRGRSIGFFFAQPLGQHAMAREAWWRAAAKDQVVIAARQGDDGLGRRAAGAECLAAAVVAAVGAAVVAASSGQ